jgi:hypothetical protein
LLVPEITWLTGLTGVSINSHPEKYPDEHILQFVKQGEHCD